MNNVCLIGRLTKDVELRHTANDIAVASFTLAVNRPFGEEEADFIQCVAWRSTAENLAKYMKKGSQISINGRIQTRTYEKDERKVYVTEVVTERIQFLESAKKEAKPQSDETPPPSSKEKPTDDFDDDLPF